MSFDTEKFLTLKYQNTIDLLNQENDALRDKLYQMKTIFSTIAAQKEKLKNSRGGIACLLRPYSSILDLIFSAAEEMNK